MQPVGSQRGCAPKISIAWPAESDLLVSRSASKQMPLPSVTHPRPEPRATAIIRPEGPGLRYTWPRGPLGPSSPRVTSFRRPISTDCCRSVRPAVERWSQFPVSARGLRRTAMEAFKVAAFVESPCSRRGKVGGKSEVKSETVPSLRRLSAANRQHHWLDEVGSVRCAGHKGGVAHLSPASAVMSQVLHQGRWPMEVQREHSAAC